MLRTTLLLEKDAVPADRYRERFLWLLVRERGCHLSAFQQIVERSAALEREGVRICSCEGNHDFFLDDYFSRQLGIEVLETCTQFRVCRHCGRIFWPGTHPRHVEEYPRTHI